LSTIFLETGTITREIGRATMKLMANPRIHFSKKPGTKPRFITVRVKDIKKDMTKDISTPNKTVEYLLLSFITFTV